MPAILRHFGINADDVQRAKRFYEGAFGWTFDAWGPPNFYQIKNETQSKARQRQRPFRKYWSISPGSERSRFLSMSCCCIMKLMSRIKINRSAFNSLTHGKGPKNERPFLP